MTTLDLYLVRHGQSYGQTATLDDMPPDCETGLMAFDWRLTPLGCQQAEMLGESLADIPFDAIYCSSLERARATVRAIIDRQPEPVPLYPMRDLLEVGDWGNETLGEIYERAQRVVAAIREQSPAGSRILVAAHGGINNRLLMVLMGLPAEETTSWRFSQDNTALSRVVFAEGEPPRLYRMNDLSHLPTDLRAQTIEENL
ncbi:MAG: histidine phosphatase family protein [Firmicutes bacterium]|nr:histidine phosphatase family protein [Bacillota bacterium]